MKDLGGGRGLQVYSWEVHKQTGLGGEKEREKEGGGGQ